MLLLVFAVLLLLTALNFYLGRSIFYPAFAFCAAWTLALFCLLVSGNMFFSLSAETLAIFMWGAFAFTLGCAAGKLPRVNSSPQPREPNKIISVCVLAFVLMFPFYVLWIAGMIAENPGEFFLAAARHSFVDMLGEDPSQHTRQFFIFATLLFLTPIVAIIAWMERKGRAARAVLAALIAFMYHGFTGARAAPIQLLLSLLCVEWLTFKKVKFKTLAIVGALIMGIFGSLAVLIHESKPIEELAGYIGGPLIAYDRVVRQPYEVPHNLTAASSFLERAYRLGFDVKPPSRESAFVATGPNREDNVFTIYFAYINVGMFVGCIILFCEAFILCLIYRSAVAGNKVAIAVYSLLFSYITMTTFSDWLLGTLEASVKLALIATAYYYFLPLKGRFGLFISAAAKEHINESLSS